MATLSQSYLPKKTNFQTTTGQNTVATVPPISQFAALGKKAADPTANIKPPATTLAPSQVSTTMIKPVSNTSTAPQIGGPNSGGTVNPNFGMQGTPSQPNNGLYGQLINQLSTFKSPVTEPALQQSQQAFQGTQDYIGQLQKSRQAEAEALKMQGDQPIPLGDITGRQQNIANYYAQQQAGLGAAAQGLSALYSPGLSAATTGAGQQLTGATSAAGFAQPQLGAFGQGYYNPLDPTGGAASSGEGALNPLNNIPSLAQAVLSGQISPQQAFAMGGNVPNFQGALSQAILQANPSANIGQLQGQYDARQQNTTTSGTAPTNAFASTYQQNYPAYLQMQSQLANVEQLGSLLLNTAGGGQINPFTPALANQTIANFKRQLSSADQARFDSTLATFQGAAQSLLANGQGQTPTNVVNQINGIANGTLSLGALKALVDQAKTEGQIKLNQQASLVNTPGGNIGAPTVGGTTGTTNTGDYQAYLKAIGAI